MTDVEIAWKPFIVRDAHPHGGLPAGAEDHEEDDEDDEDGEEEEEDAETGSDSVARA